MRIGVAARASVAGYYRGWVDTVVARLTEITMAFPALLFIIALASTVGSRLDNVTFGGSSVAAWSRSCSCSRSSAGSSRRGSSARRCCRCGRRSSSRQPRCSGASDWRIMRSHLLPHLVAPIIVFSTLIVAGFVLAEAGLSFLGLGIKLPTPSWGNLLATAPEFYTAQPWLMVWPGLAVLLSRRSRSTCSATPSETPSIRARLVAASPIPRFSSNLGRSVPRNRTVRLAVLGSSVQRAAAAKYPSRSGTVAPAAPRPWGCSCCSR